MAEIWPVSLPQTPLLEGYSNIPRDSVLRSSMDGYTKQRNRFTAALKDVTEFYLLAPTEFTTFVDFFENTLSNGAKEFIKEDTITKLDKVHRFVEPYSFEFNGVSYRVELTLEILP